MYLQVRLVLAAALSALATPLFAQTPNTSGIVVAVVDQQNAVVKDAAVTVVNKATGLSRATVSNDAGLATITALPLTGTYSVNVTKPGFTAEEVADLALRSGETASVKVTLVASGGTTEVVVFGTTEGVRANEQIGERLQSETIDELPILGRKAKTLPLFNSAFRQGKGTGDLFVNATYFITGGGSRRTTTYMLDGANNDEGWGRQTMIATVPIGAIEEISILSNAFSAEYGWTAGPALNIVTKSGTNAVHGEGLYLARPGGMQAKTFSTKNFCAPEVATCVTPTTLVAINPADTPDELNQFSMSVGAPIKKDRTFLYFSTDYTMQDRTTFLSPTLPSFVLPADGSLDYVGEYRQTLGNVRVDHKLTPSHTLMMRANWDKFHDTNPNDAVAGTSAPTVARKYSRGSVTGQVNLTSVLGPSLVNEGRVSYLHGDPVTLWEAQEMSTTYTRAGSVPFTIGQSRVSDVFSHQWQFSDTLTWSKATHNIRFGTNLVHHESGGFGNEPGFAVLGTFTFLAATAAPFDQLTLNDVQQYTQPISYGVTTYEQGQWLLTGYAQDSWRVSDDLTLDLGLGYDQQTLTDANANFAPRIGFGWHPGGDSKLAIRGGYGLYYTQIRSNAISGS